MSWVRVSFRLPVVTAYTTHPRTWYSATMERQPPAPVCPCPCPCSCCILRAWSAAMEKSAAALVSSDSSGSPLELVVPLLLLPSGGVWADEPPDDAPSSRTAVVVVWVWVEVEIGCGWEWVRVVACVGAYRGGGARRRWC